MASTASEADASFAVGLLGALPTAARTAETEAEELADLRGQIAAIGRSHAVVEFELDGTIRTANENFCRLLGYSLAEIQGHHHQMFVEPEEAASEDYEQFWQSLRNGEFHAEEFKRVGKGGRQVWIQASYNPIFDESGKACKVVKYATDVTRQVELRQHLADGVGQVLSIGEVVSSSAEEMATLGEQVAANAAEVSAQAETVSSAAEEVNANLQTVSAAAEQLAASIVTVATNTADAARVSASAVAAAETARQTMARLDASSGEISTVIKVITSIAQQTNLLALNATIEAARAGESGKGFAVVANEVKELAKQTAQATEDIGKRIEASQSDTAAAVSAIGEISEIIDRINEISGAIAEAVREQQSTTGAIAESINEAAFGSGEIARNISGVAETAESTSRAVTENRELTLGLSQIANELRSLAEQLASAG